MNRRLAVLAGLMLVVMGGMALLTNVLMPLLGLRMVWWSIGRMWPLAIMGLGTAFVLPPLLTPRRRGLGGLFIPGMPVLMTGALLFLSSLTGWWGLWARFWPMMLLSVAAGFLLAAWHMRVIWLLIPAFVVGANGLLFQFCAITGLWQVWAVMWTIEPLAVGLALLLIDAAKRQRGVTLAGLILCSIAGFAMVGMMTVLSLSTVISVWWWFRLPGPALIILAGILLVLWSLGGRPLAWTRPR